MHSKLVRLLAVFGIVASVLTGLAATQVEAAGRSLYVAVDGDDAASGGRDDPFRTINAAMRIVEPGDTVWVGGGVYDDQADDHAAVRLSRSGTADAWITLRAMPGERPIVRATGHNGIQTWGPDYWHIEGFEVDGSYSSINAGAGIAWGNEAHHVRIVDNWVHGFRGGGISGVRGDYIHIEGNRVWGNANQAPNQTSGISLYQNVAFDDAAGFHNVITGNEVFDNENLVPNPDSGVITDGNCVIIDDFRHTQFASPYPVYDEATLITNNLCYDNGGRGVHVYLADNVHVANNTLYRNTRSPAIDHGELSAIDSTNISFVNNLVVSRGGVEPVKLWQATDITFESNVYLETHRASPEPGERFLTLADARLRNPTDDWDALDPTPRPDSPLVGSGAREPAVPVDARGMTRPVPPTPGAYEPVEGPAPEPTRIDGRVGSESGRSPSVVVDLFAAAADGSRAAYLTSVRSDDTGRYSFTPDAGCYVVVIIAPTGLSFTTGSPWAEGSVCAEAGEVAPGPTPTVADGSTEPDRPGSIGDRVTDGGGAGVGGVVVDLFEAAADGSRAGFLTDTTTGADGGYQLDVDRGCYVIVFIAPDGYGFADGSRYDQRALCVGSGQVIDDADAVVRPTDG